MTEDPRPCRPLLLFCPRLRTNKMPWRHWPPRPRALAWVSRPSTRASPCLLCMPKTTGCCGLSEVGEHLGTWLVQRFLTERAAWREHTTSTGYDTLLDDIHLLVFIPVVENCLAWPSTTGRVRQNEWRARLGILCRIPRPHQGSASCSMLDNAKPGTAATLCSKGRRAPQN